MTPLALLLVLAAALSHATWNLVAKKSGGGGNFLVLMSSMLVGVLWLPIVIWAGVQEMAQWGVDPWLILAASAVVHVLYFRALLHGYAVSDLTVVYPVARGSGPLLSSIGALILLGESMSFTSAMGALAVVAGVFLIAGGPALWQQAHDPTKQDRIVRGLAWGALTGAFIAAYTVIDGYAVKVMLISPILVDYVGNVLRVPVMLPFALRDPSGFAMAFRAQWKPALVIAVLGPLSYVMVLYAVRLAPLSHVAPAREVSMLFAALLGGQLLGESDRAVRLLGATCMAGGVVGLALG